MYIFFIDITVYYDGNTYTLSWLERIFDIYDDVVIETEKKDTIIITIKKGLTFKVHRSVGDDIGMFMGIFVINSDGLSKDTKGVIGAKSFNLFRLYVTQFVIIRLYSYYQEL